MNKQYVLLTYGLEPLIKGYICDKFMRPNNNQSNNTHLKTIPAMYLSLKRASLSNIGRLKVQFLTSLLESTILLFWDIPCCVLKIAHFGSARSCLPYRGRILTKLHFRQGEMVRICIFVLLLITMKCEIWNWQQLCAINTFQKLWIQFHS